MGSRRSAYSAMKITKFNFRTSFHLFDFLPNISFEPEIYDRVSNLVVYYKTENEILHK